VVVAFVGLVFVMVALTAPHLLGVHFARAFTKLGSAHPAWLWLAGVAFLVSFLGSAAAWRTTLAVCGIRVRFRDSCARYGIGSLVNTVAPFQLGDVVRVGLYSRVVTDGLGAWTVTGGLAAIAVVRASCLAVLATVAWALGGLPLWPLFVLGGLVGVALAIAIRARKKAPCSRAGHLLDAFRALASSPREAGWLFAWVGLALASRVCAGAAIGVSLGVHSPLIAALLIVTALDLAGQFPLTPGNVGVANGAVAIALGSRGVALATALAIGLAFQAVQTTVDVGAGSLGLLHVAPKASRFASRHVAQVAAALVVIGVSVAFSLTVLANVA
jgi:uncharacterized membrane protein YbhN (UPF0104 family)